MSQTLSREPIEFAAGDTLTFLRSLPDFSAADGWSLLYVLRGGAQPIEFTSTASGSGHSVSVDSATTATWLPGDYVLSGFAVKGDERHQVYYGSLTVLPNAAAQEGDAPAKTHAQQMVEMLEKLMLTGGGQGLLESRIGETMFKYQSMREVREEHGYWFQVRKQEIAKERAKAGLPTGNKIRLQINIKTPGPLMGYGSILRGNG